MVVRTPDNLCVVCGSIIPEGRMICPICGTKDDIEGYAQLIRKSKPAPEFKVDDAVEQAYHQGYSSGFSEGMKAACELKQQNEHLKRRIVVLENQARNTVDDIDGEFE